jgi:lipid-binding SYLF domain-containing protein
MGMIMALGSLSAPVGLVPDGVVARLQAPVNAFDSAIEGDVSMNALSRRHFLALSATAAATALARPGFAMSEPQQLVEKSRIAFLDIITDSNFSAMAPTVKRARGLLIFPNMLKGAFIIGAEGGSGVLVARSTEGWSYPAFYTIASGSLGLQIGGQSAELVITIMSAKAMNAVIENQFKIGGNVDVAAGPVGMGLTASTTTNLNADAYSWAKAEGLFAGLSLDGSGIFKRDSWNNEYYGFNAQPADIVLNNKYSNKNAQILRDALAPY